MSVEDSLVGGGLALLGVLVTTGTAELARWRSGKAAAVQLRVARQRELLLDVQRMLVSLSRVTTSIGTRRVPSADANGAFAAALAELASFVGRVEDPSLRAGLTEHLEVCGVVPGSLSKEQAAAISTSTAELMIATGMAIQDLEA